MSYNVIVALPPIPDDDASAWTQLDSLVELEGPRPEVFLELHRRLTTRFPCICDDAAEGEEVWSDGPLINNFGHRAAVLGIQSGFVEEVVPFIVNEAAALGLVMFDPVTGKLHRGPLLQVTPPTGLSPAEIRKIIGRELGSILQPYGFKHHKTWIFALRHGKDLSAVGHTLVNNRPWYRFTLYCLVRLDEVEKIRLPFSGVDPRFWPQSFSTVFNLPKSLVSGFEVRSESDIVRSLHAIRDQIEGEMIPLMQRCSTPEGLLEELRNPKSGLAPILASPGDLMRDLALTVLCEPQNLERRIQGQTDSVSRMDPRVSAPYFRLVEHLREAG